MNLRQRTPQRAGSFAHDANLSPLWRSGCFGIRMHETGRGAEKPQGDNMMVLPAAQVLTPP